MISIIVPLYNEEESINIFYQTLQLLKKLAVPDKSIRIFSFRSNRGKAEALTVGFLKAKGEKIITLDADLQDKPSEIKKLLLKQEKEGIDLISGWRKNRKDKSKMVITSKVFNYIAGKLFFIN